MRTILLILTIVVFSRSAVQAQDQVLPPIVKERLTAIAVATTATEEDERYVEATLKNAGIEECVAMAALYRHWPEKYGTKFSDYYRIDSTVKTSVLPDTEINERVSTLLRQLKGRHPLEISGRVYLAFRGTGFVAKKRDGSDMNLEMMFRGAVFTGVSNGNREEVLRLSAIADGKSTPNHSPEPTPGAVH